MATRSRVEFGDWQTPDELSREVVAHIARIAGAKPKTILEPTCGKGAFLAAAAQQFPKAALVGYEINPEYAAEASARLENLGARIHTADFFQVDWQAEIAAMAHPVLVLGNPPWVTTAGLGAIGAKNAPKKQNFKGLAGLDARTGKGNFDVSEWMLIHLLRALVGHEGTLAMLCKSAVARRIIEFVARGDSNVTSGGLWRIDTARHFRASVDAVVFVCHTEPNLCPSPVAWPVYDSLHAAQPTSFIGIVDGELVADVEAYRRSESVVGMSRPEWRSGIKHDCAPIMELELRDDCWFNGQGEVVDIEPHVRYPVLKSSDLANGRVFPSKSVIVPQKFLGDDTYALRETAPKLWAYLQKHAENLGGRKSSIYKNQPPFAIFGIGEYSFAPWKVAISGFYKRLRFCVLGPHDQQPVMLDDTCYFLPFSSEGEARTTARALESDLAADFFRSRIFWDAKRPINKSMLQNLAREKLLQLVESPPAEDDGQFKIDKPISFA